MASINNIKDLVSAYEKYLKEPTYKGKLTEISEREVQSKSEIPLIEVSEHFDSEDNGQSRKILFIGFNPSGADLKYYSKHNTCKPNDVLIYKGNSNYYEAMNNFANDCGFNCYSELDVLGVVRKTQSDVVVHFMDNTSLYTTMLDIFLDAVKGIAPSVIIVANAFVRKLFIAKANSLHCRPKKEDPVVRKLRNNHDLIHFYNRITLLANNNNGGYKLYIDKEPSFQLFFSCMLSGQRAIDLGNRENLIWLVRNYLMKGYGMKI